MADIPIDFKNIVAKPISMQRMASAPVAVLQ